mmetsp:Transcript_6565/g.11505  ORF Transcript_6565/g.11505 Transcript_6565/m.11505 type:complete len:461 (-) Transcript_6565:447-1829(-)
MTGGNGRLTGRERHHREGRLPGEVVHGLGRLGRRPLQHLRHPELERLHEHLGGGRAPDSRAGPVLASRMRVVPRGAAAVLPSSTDAADVVARDALHLSPPDARPLVVRDDGAGGHVRVGAAAGQTRRIPRHERGLPLRAEARRKKFAALVLRHGGQVARARAMSPPLRVVVAVVVVHRVGPGPGGAVIDAAVRRRAPRRRGGGGGDGAGTLERRRAVPGKDAARLKVRGPFQDRRGAQRGRERVLKLLLRPSAPQRRFGVKMMVVGVGGRGHVPQVELAVGGEGHLRYLRLLVILRRHRHRRPRVVVGGRRGVHSDGGHRGGRRKQQWVRLSWSQPRCGRCYATVGGLQERMRRIGRDEGVVVVRSSSGGRLSVVAPPGGRPPVVRRRRRGQVRRQRLVRTRRGLAQERVELPTSSSVAAVVSSRLARKRVELPPPSSSSSLGDVGGCVVMMIRLVLLGN